MTGDTPQGPTPGCCPEPETVAWKPQFRLAEGDTPPCGHLEVRPGPPRLWAALTIVGQDDLGWANLSFHWTGNEWAPCDPASWAIGPHPGTQHLEKGAECALSAANAVPAGDWLTSTASSCAPTTTRPGHDWSGKRPGPGARRPASDSWNAPSRSPS